MNEKDYKEVLESIENDQVETTDTSNEPSEEAVKEVEQPKKAQSEKVNSYYAQKRREQEKKEKTYNDGIREAIKVNPYTNEVMNDDFDLQVYQEMKRLDDLGEDPLKGIAKAFSTYRRESETKIKQESERQESISKDVKEFQAEFPNVSVKNLTNDEMFVDYANGKWGNIPLAQIYKGYLKFKGSQKQETPKAQTPTSISQGTPKVKSVDDLTDEEVEKEFYKKFTSNF